MTAQHLQNAPLAPSFVLWPSLQAEMPSLAAGMATAQQADIIIGVHGA